VIDLIGPSAFRQASRNTVRKVLTVMIASGE
jgi:hypothetical protein